MQRDHAYNKFRVLLLQAFQQKQLVATDEAVEDFVRLAEANGFYLDDLIKMTESGMTGQQIAEAVLAGVEKTRGMPSVKRAGR